MGDEDEDEEIDRLWHDPQILWEASLTIPKSATKTHPFNVPSVQKTRKIAFHPKVTFFVGENGSGKSTWMEAIAIAFGFRAEGGTLRAKSESYPAHSTLHQALRLKKTRRVQKDGFFLRAESFFNWASAIDNAQSNWSGYGSSPFEAYGGQSLHDQSHGESFLSLIENRFRPPGLFILDEPEAALSPQRQLTFLARIHEHIRVGAQFIIATHSPIILAYPDAKILEFSEQGIQEAAYEDIEHVRITKSFLNRREIYLETLLADDE